MRIIFTTSEDTYIRKHYLTKPIKRIASDMGRSYCGVMGRIKKMQLTIPPDVTDRHKKVGRFKPGHVSHNKGVAMDPAVYEKAKKTFFKKGNLPHNTLHDGAITIRKDRRGIPHKFIRIKLGVWKHLSRHNWEQEHGVIPRSHMIIFKDGDTLNCDISNLRMISKADNAMRNQMHHYPPEVKEVIVLNNKLKRKIRHAKKQN